jgi:hypothetical protein
MQAPDNLVYGVGRTRPAFSCPGVSPLAAPPCSARPLPVVGYIFSSYHVLSLSTVSPCMPPLHFRLPQHTLPRAPSMQAPPAPPLNSMNMIPTPLHHSCPPAHLYPYIPSLDILHCSPIDTTTTTLHSFFIPSAPPITTGSPAAGQPQGNITHTYVQPQRPTPPIPVPHSFLTFSLHHTPTPASPAAACSVHHTSRQPQQPTPPIPVPHSSLTFSLHHTPTPASTAATCSVHHTSRQPQQSHPLSPSSPLPPPAPHIPCVLHVSLAPP